MYSILLAGGLCLTRSRPCLCCAGQEKYDKVRTSSGMFFQRGQNELIKRIEKKVAMVTMLPEGHAEGMQVLHYEVSEGRRCFSAVKKSVITLHHVVQ
jgi:hypothetical protein